MKFFQTKTFKKIMFAAVGIFIFLFIIIFNQNFSWENFSRPNIIFILIAFSLNFFLNGVVAIRWGVITNSLEKKKTLGIRKSLFYFSLTNFLSYFSFQELSSFGLKAGSLAAENVSFHKATNVYLIEKIINLLNLLSVIWVSILYFSNLIDWELALILFITALFFVYFILGWEMMNLTKLVFWFNRLFLRITKLIPFLKNKINFENLAKQNLAIIVTPKDVQKFFFLSILKLFFYAFFVYSVFMALNLPINFIVVLLALPITDLTTLFAFTPGALGIFEAGWLIILKLVDMTGGDVNIFLIGYRILSILALLFNLLIGYFLYLTLKRWPQNEKQLI